MLQKIKQGRLYLLGVVAIIVVLAAGHMVSAGDFQPGSQEDPLVTQSYVEQRNEQLKYYSDQKDQELSDLIQQNGDRIAVLEEKLSALFESGNTAASLEIVTLTPGQRLIGWAGTEIILRGGRATAIQSELGGLSDVTGGRDIKQDEEIPANHLLLIPRSDGRGIKAVTECILMVRGQYDIQ